LDAVAKHVSYQKPKPTLYMKNPETGGFTLRRECIFGRATRRAVRAPREDFMAGITRPDKQLMQIRGYSKHLSY
jgi:hypothetical protein